MAPADGASERACVHCLARGLFPDREAQAGGSKETAPALAVIDGIVMRGGSR